MIAHPKRGLVGSLVAIALVVACSSTPAWNTGEGGTPAVAAEGGGSGSGIDTGAPSGSGGLDEGGATADTGPSGSGGSSSGSTVYIPSNDGGPCQMCSTDSDCKTSCASMKLMPGYLWCCQSAICIPWGATSCPAANSSSSSGGGGGPCGAAMQPCCSSDPQCQMGLSCQSDGTCG
jgi:hypothetical protein